MNEFKATGVLSALDPGPIFFTESDDAGIGFSIDVGEHLDGHDGIDEDDIDTDQLLEDAELLGDDDIDEDDEIFRLANDDDVMNHDFRIRPPPSASSSTSLATNQHLPKFQMRIQPPGTTAGKRRRRGRPSKAEVAARIAANGGVAPPSKPKKPANEATTSGVKRHLKPVLSNKAKSLRRKVSSSTWGRVHRERRNASVEAMRKVLPGVGTKLDTAGVMELAIQYILFLKKKLSVEVTNEGFVAMADNKEAESSMTSSSNQTLTSSTEA